jgi:hypothetical protein
MKTMHLIPFHPLHYSHYYEPFSPQLQPLDDTDSFVDISPLQEYGTIKMPSESIHTP